MTPDALFDSALESLPLLRKGKVRDVYAVDEDKLLIVASDRLSAFDVILPTPIPGKGRLLTSVSNFWFERTNATMDNHILDIPLEQVLSDPAERERVRGRAVVAKRFKPLPVEAIVRGYIVGTGWKDYQASGAVCGVKLPAGLRLADRLPEPIFTPSTKAAVGEHDENISFDEAARLLGGTVAEQVRDATLKVYKEARDFAASRGIIIADTKMEFGMDDDGRVVLIDELLTPDSSRFWPADEYRPGANPPSFDKQYVRDWLEGSGWDKKPPAPDLPADVVARTAEKYREAERRLTGK
ncbi:MAG: phosphoribosylaminoimidazolesuccinocarboxamide synthase [Magnetospirillum sp. WYHS-4]